MRDTAKAQVISLMRKMIGKEVENKLVGHVIETAVLHNSAIANADMVSVLPQITSGTTAQTRLGDRIKPKSLVLRGNISVDPGVTDNKVLYVRVIIASQKDIKVGSQVGTSTDPQRLLRTGVPGASDQIPFNGNRNELLYKVNDLKFRVYMDKVFALAPQGATTGDQPRSCVRFSYAFKKLPSSLSFDEGNGNWANNFAPFIATGYAFADGTAPDIVATRVSTDYHATLAFEDA